MSDNASIMISDTENNKHDCSEENENILPPKNKTSKLEKFEPNLPVEPMFCCLTTTTIWTLIGLVLFIPGIAKVVLIISTVFVKIGIAINDFDPALNPESTLEINIDPIDVIFGILQGCVLMMHGFCVLSGLHGPVIMRRPMYLIIALLVFSIYSISLFIFSVISTCLIFKLKSECGLTNTPNTSVFDSVLCPLYVDKDGGFNYFMLVVYYVATGLLGSVTFKLFLYYKYVRKVNG